MNHLTISEAARILIGKTQEGMYPIKLAHLNTVITDVESEVTRVESLITSTSAGLVEDSLTNGVIDKAPSQNVVYDALTTNLNDAKSYSDSIVLGLLDDRGSFTPSGTYPTTGGSGTSGAIMKGDVWYITGLGSGVTALVGSQEVKDGDTVRALSNTPGQTDANWDVMSSPVNAITVQTLINSRTAQATPADADNIPITDGASGNAFKRLTWGTVKSLLASIFVSKVTFPVAETFAVSDESTALTAGTAKITVRLPYAFTLTGVQASLVTAQTSGSILTIDVNQDGVSVLSTKLTIDNTEKISTTSATPAVISTSAFTNYSEITIDIDQIGDGTAKGLKISLIGTRSI